MLEAGVQQQPVMNEQPTPAFAVFDDYRPMVTISVAVRWALLAVWYVIINYRVESDSVLVIFNLMATGLLAGNAYITWRILTRQPITWRHALLQGFGDLSVITAALFLRHGIMNPFYVFYYPALLGFSLMFPGRPSFGAVALVIGLYVVIAFTVSPKFDYAQEHEKLMLGRITAMLGMVVAGILIYRWERSRRREAVEAERQIAEENLELQRKTQVAELAAVEERSRISREIHDGIAQSIYMLSLNLETCADLAQRQRQELTQRLEMLVGLSKETLLEVRHYIFDLKPYLAGEKGVVDMVENQVREFNMVAAVPTSLETNGEAHQVPVPVATCLYRVTQEALANAFKHAGASKVQVNLDFAPGGVLLKVQDDGRGFDPSDSISGHGLRNIRYRAEELQGTFSLKTAPGAGTEVLVQLPC